MSEKLQRNNKKFKINTKIQQKEKEESNNLPLKDPTLIGNKRERTPSISIETICEYCKIPIHSKYLTIDSLENTKEYIINEFKIMDNDFQKNLLEILKELFPKNKKETNIMCCSCVQKKFIRGGVVNLLELDCINNKKSDESKCSENIKILKDIYTLNLQLIISQVKNIKIKLMKAIENIKEIFSNTAIRVMLSNFKDSFMKIKEDMDKCGDKFEEINRIFEKLISDCTSKEKLQSLYINNLFNNNEKNYKKEKLLQFLKDIEIEIISIPEEIYTKNKNKEQENDVCFNTKNEVSKKTLDFSLLKNKNFVFTNNFNFNNVENINNTKINNNKPGSLNSGQEKNYFNQLLNLPNIGLGKQYSLYYLQKIQYFKERLGWNNQAFREILINKARNKGGANQNLKTDLSTDHSDLSNNLFSKNIASRKQFNSRLSNLVNSLDNNIGNISNINNNNNIDNNIKDNNSNISSNIVTNNTNNTTTNNEVLTNNVNDVNNDINSIMKTKNNDIHNDSNIPENDDSIKNKNNDDEGNTLSSVNPVENSAINNNPDKNKDNSKTSNLPSLKKQNNKNNLPLNYLNIDLNSKIDMKKIENSIKIQNLINTANNNNNLFNIFGNNNSEMFSELLELFKLSPSLHYLLFDNYFNNHSNINISNSNLPNFPNISNLSELLNINKIPITNSQSQFKQSSSLINQNTINKSNQNQNITNNDSNNIMGISNPNIRTSYNNLQQNKQKKEGTASLLVNMLTKVAKEKKSKQMNNQKLINNKKNNNTPNVSINISIDSNEENNTEKTNLQQNKNTTNSENKNTDLEKKGDLSRTNNSDINANNSAKSKNDNENTQVENTKNDISIFLNQS